MSNPVTIDDLYQLEFIGQLKGFQDDLVFVRGVCDEENNTYQKNLELCRDHRVSALTGPESSAGFVFTEDGRVWFTSPVPEKRKREPVCMPSAPREANVSWKRSWKKRTCSWKAWPGNICLCSPDRWICWRKNRTMKYWMKIPGI